MPAICGSDTFVARLDRLDSRTNRIWVSILLRYFCGLDSACRCKSGFGVSVSIASVLFRFRCASFLLEIDWSPPWFGFLAAGGQRKASSLRQAVRKDLKGQPQTSLAPHPHHRMRVPWRPAPQHVFVRQISDGVRTSGVVAEVPRFPTINSQGRLGGNTRQLMATCGNMCAFEPNGIANCRGVVVPLWKPRSSRPRLEAADLWPLPNKSAWA